MTEGKGIQLPKGSKGIQITKGSKEANGPSYSYGIEISRTGKPIEGKVPELLGLAFRCGVTRRNFQVIIEEKQTGREFHYKVVKVLQVDGHPRDQKVSPYQPIKLDINVGNIEGITNVKCPHCGGGKIAVIKCGCGGLSCGGGIKREGEREYNECPWCRSVGIIKGNIETLSGEKTRSHDMLRGDREVSMGILKSTNPSVKTLPSGSKQLQKR